MPFSNPDPRPGATAGSSSAECDEPIAASGEPAPDEAHLHSVSRPMSAAERAELEEVYRERGCSGEC